MGLRTAAEVQEEYNATRAAYLKAIDAEKINYASGTTNRSLERSKSSELKQQMIELSDEYDRLSQGSTITVLQGVPSGK